MNKNVKIILCVIAIFAIFLVILDMSLKQSNKEENNGKLNIVVTTFSSYDFSKQITGNKANITFLVGPGGDSHSYEPTAAELIKIQNSDVFIYIGGEMEPWVDKVLETDTINAEKTKLVKITEAVEVIEEMEVDGAEREEAEANAYDEHIWTSPTNAIKMIQYLTEIYANLDAKNTDEYRLNSNAYIEKIRDLQSKIQEIVDNKKRSRLVFGDKMPMQYFLNEYGLTASAAFNGCSTEAEPSAKTIIYLINRVQEEEIPVVLYIELSTGKTAVSIAKETGKEAMQIQTLHNVSKDDFQNGETYVSLMTRNLEVLKKALL